MRTAIACLVVVVGVLWTAPVSFGGEPHVRKHRDRNRDGDKDNDGKNDRAERREGNVDQREDRQQKRIEHGIAKGYLTPSEVSKLQKMEQEIADTEASFKSDGKLTRKEHKQLREMLNDASVQIWAEKHDTEGNQMPTYRFGKNVFASNELTDRIESGSLTGAEARALLKEFREAAAAKRRLSNDDLGADQRSKLQNAYNEFLNKYFLVR
jgi:hypothetical protein